MKILFRRATVLILFLTLGGCSLFQSTGDSKKYVIGEIGGEPILYHDLRSSFHTAPEPEGNDIDINQEIMDFLDLYMDYRLKLRAAADGGYLNNEEILGELNQYEMQSVYPYWLEKRFRDELLDELVERSHDEIHVSHILIATEDNASPADTLQAWNTLLDARNEYLNGDRSFDEIAEQYSTRRQGRSMGGDLGYISAGWAVKDFEDVAYNTGVGEVSMPFKTGFGYHVLKVYDRREKQPDRNYSHIFFRTRGAGFSEGSARFRADEAFAQLQEGKDWNKVTEEFSDDTDSKARGGDIGWIDVNRYQPLFVENITAIENQGDYTEPFLSEYGYHIVRLDSIRTYRDEAHLREAMYERLRNLPRYRENRSFTMRNVRAAANDTLFGSTYAEFTTVLEANPDKEFAEIQFQAALLSKPLYRIDGITRNLGHFVEAAKTLVANNQPQRFQHSMLERYIDDQTDSVVVSVTKRVFPEFAELSKRYLDGLAVFKITEDSVWTYAMHDTLRLRQLYEDNPEDYWFGRRYRYYRITADSDEKLADARKIIEHGLPIEDIREAVTGLILRTDIINNIDDFPFNHLSGLNNGGFSEIFEYRNRPTMLYLEEILEPRQMTFDEAYMKLDSDYQPIREREWLDRLREHYNVVHHSERLRRILTEKGS